MKYSKQILAVSFLFIATVVLFSPAMLGWKGIFHDDQLEEFTRYCFVARSFQNGIIPLWDPHIWCGAIPFYAKYYANTYYVLLWPFYFLTNLDNLSQAYWMLILIPLFIHYFLAALGMFLFLRIVIRCKIVPACLGAVVYIFSPAFSYAYVWQQVVIVQTWLPWLLMVYSLTVRRYKLWKIITGGVILNFIITGAAPTLWPFVGFIWFGLIMVDIFSNFHSGKKFSCIAKPLLIVLLIVVIGIGLSSVYLFSFYDGIQYTQEHIQLTVDTALADPVGSFPPLFLSTIFIPNLFDNITGFAMPYMNPDGNMLYWEGNISGGMAISFLVLLGIISAFIYSGVNVITGEQRIYVKLFLVLYVFAILCILGKYTPFYRYIIGHLYGVGQMPRPIRYRLIQCFSASVLVAMGLHYLISIKPNYERAKKILHFAICFYLALSFVVVATAMILPLKSKDKVKYQWVGKPNVAEEGKFFPEDIAGYFPERVAAGNYSPDAVSRKISIFFDSKSTGEIRSSDNQDELSPDKGFLLSKYNVPDRGWYDFNVTVPPKKFVWVYQKTGTAKIGYIDARDEVLDAFFYDKEWKSKKDAIAICFYQELHMEAKSLLKRLLQKDIYSNLVVISVIYWLIAIIMLFISIYIFSPFKAGMYIAGIVVLECFGFGMFSFYGGTFSWDNPNPRHIRSVGPNHPLLKRSLNKLIPTITNPTLRVATTRPSHDNFMRIAGYFSLMGYEMHPLEKRFKKAIETVYGQPMNYAIYYREPRPRPKYWQFMNNFSVGYLMSRSRLTKFPQGHIVEMPGEKDLFISINENVLPRAYTIDKLIAASEKEQLNQLITGDLRNGVYINYEDKMHIESISPVEREEKYVDFDKLQKDNPVTYIDFSNPNSINLKVNITKPSMLVLTEIWYPGWYASVDSKNVPLYKVNYCQRGIWLEKGYHVVKFYFCPLLWRYGMHISVCIVLLLAILSCGLLMKTINKR